mgnify:CR=1 FL=1
MAGNDSGFINGYRLSKKTGGLESLPHRFDPITMGQLLSALRDARTLGAHVPNTDNLTALALIEGRSDFGFNQLDQNNKKAVQLADTLSKEPYNHTQLASQFAAAVMDKMQAAQRLKIPFAKAWNGTGRSEYGQTGDEYAKFHQQHVDDAAREEKNSDLRNFINTHLYSEFKPTPPPPKPKSWMEGLFGQNAPPADDISNTTLPDEYSPGGRERLI